MRILKFAALPAAVFLGLGAANATPVSPFLVYAELAQGSKAGDCPGTFGSSFGDCDIGFGLPNDPEVSPVIAKYDVDKSTWEQNSDFSLTLGNVTSSSSSQITISNATGSSGTWEYSPEIGDPAIRYWSTKAGSTVFRLFWISDDESACNSSATDGTNYNLACLETALAVNSGSWSSPESKELSHIVFYDTGVPPIPLPAAGWLLLAGLGGLAAYGRKKRWA